MAAEDSEARWVEAKEATEHVRSAFAMRDERAQGADARIGPHPPGLLEAAKAHVLYAVEKAARQRTFPFAHPSKEFGFDVVLVKHEGGCRVVAQACHLARLDLDHIKRGGSQELVERSLHLRHPQGTCVKR